LLGVGVGGVLGCEDPGPFRGPSVFNPSTLDFGMAAVGQTEKKVTDMASPGDRLQVQGVTFQPAQKGQDLGAIFSARLANGGGLTGTLLNAGMHAEIEVDFLPREAMSYDANMVVDFGSTKVELTITGSGRKTVDASLHITPMDLVFPTTVIGADVIRTVQVLNVGDVGGTIQEVLLGSTGAGTDSRQVLYATVNGSSASIVGQDIGAGQTIMVDVHFKPSTAGQLMDSLEFVLDNGDKTDLPISGEGVAAGTLHCDPSTLDYGDVVRGDVSDLNVTCTSTQGYYTLDAFAFAAQTASNFMFLTPPVQGTMLGPMDHFQMTIRFVSEGTTSVQTGGVILTSGGKMTMLYLTGRVAPPPLDQTAIHVELSWNAVIDLDLHFVRNGLLVGDPMNDCFWDNRTPLWGTEATSPYLDNDATNGYGPEIMNLRQAADGQYDVYVHYYQHASGGNAYPTVRIAFFGNFQQPDETAVLMSCGTLWHAAQIMVQHGTAQVMPLSTLTPLPNPVRNGCP
jgi:hypothetical protein